ncbi:hypothetical protein F4818DRAFT_56195 [Hypoxylon cercidicola]|nr:hypothetical protein F4818DRAFT_56195 [Hypoxylon cercidicola]
MYRELHGSWRIWSSGLVVLMSFDAWCRGRRGLKNQPRAPSLFLAFLSRRSHSNGAVRHPITSHQFAKGTLSSFTDHRFGTKMQHLT